MSDPRPTVPTPIAYNLESAAAAIGRNVRTIQRAIAKGALIPRYADSRPMIGHAELLAWFNHLPLDRPTS